VFNVPANTVWLTWETRNTRSGKKHRDTMERWRTMCRLCGAAKPRTGRLQQLADLRPMQSDVLSPLHAQTAPLPPAHHQFNRAPVHTYTIKF